MLDPLPGGAGDPDVVQAERLFAPAERVVDAPFSAQDADARRRRRRGRRAQAPRRARDASTGSLGEILVGLDRAGHLRRLVRPPAVEPAPDATSHAAPPEPVDHVERLLALIRDALAAADGRRLARSATTAGGWATAPTGTRPPSPLADRVEWAVYSLLSTAGPLSEAAFLDRIAGLFTGPDLPDEALVRACLDSLSQPRQHAGPARSPPMTSCSAARSTAS